VNTETMTSREAAEFLGVCKTSVQRLRDAGYLTDGRPQGGYVTTDSVLLFDAGWPVNDSGARPMPRGLYGKTIAPNVEEIPRVGGGSTYRVRFYGGRGGGGGFDKTYRTRRGALAAAERIRRQQSAPPAPPAPPANTDTPTLWTRLRAWLTNADTTGRTA